MRKYIILPLICSFLSILPALGSSEDPLFEREFSAFKAAQNAFHLTPCVDTLNNTLEIATPLFQVMKVQAFNDLQILVGQHEEASWDKACLQTKMLLQLQPHSSEENPTLRWYTCVPTPENQTQDAGQNEVALRLCQARAECATLLENFIDTKNNFYGICTKTKQDLLVKIAQKNHHAHSNAEDVEPEVFLSTTPTQISTAEQMMTRQWEIFDRHNTIFNQISNFYWGVEKELVRAIMKDRANNADDHTSSFQPLWGAWVDSGQAQSLRVHCVASLVERLPLLLYSFLIVEEHLAK